MIDKLEKTFTPNDILKAADMNLITGKIDEVVEGVNNGETEIGEIKASLEKKSEVGKKTGSDGTGEIFNDYETNIATGNCSHAEGLKTTASGPSSHSEGNRTIASGICSHAEGMDTMAVGKQSHAEGYIGVAEGPNSHIEGGTNFSIYLTGEVGVTEYEVSLGKLELYSFLKVSELPLFFSKGSRVYTSKVSDSVEVVSSRFIEEEGGDKFFITVDKTLTPTNPASEIGFKLLRHKVSGTCSHVEGSNSHVTTNYSHSEGYFNSDCVSTGAAANHIEGQLNVVLGGQAIHLEGRGNQVQNQTEHAQGFYNKSNTGSDDSQKTLHSIGIGTRDLRKNAQEVMKNGDFYVVGVGGYDGTNPESSKTLQEVISELTNNGGEGIKKNITKIKYSITAKTIRVLLPVVLMTMGRLILFTRIDLLNWIEWRYSIDGGDIVEGGSLDTSDIPPISQSIENASQSSDYPPGEVVNQAPHILLQNLLPNLKDRIDIELSIEVKSGLINASNFFEGVIWDDLEIVGDMFKDSRYSLYNISNLFSSFCYNGGLNFNRYLKSLIIPQDLFINLGNLICLNNVFSGNLITELPENLFKLTENSGNGVDLNEMFKDCANLTTMIKSPFPGEENLLLHETSVFGRFNKCFSGCTKLLEAYPDIPETMK